jgi:quinohemoprotein ethanol dehydrogenase
MGVMNAGWKYGDQPRRLLSFTLDGKATLPPTAPQRFSVQALDDPAIKLDDVDVHRGESLFNAKCAACHGLNAVSAGPPGPDLRESQVALRREALYSVVHDGAIAQRGMPPFAELDATQVAQMYAYIRARARDTQSNQPAAPPPRP